ncbi:MAG TPA: sigma-70 family RNA polymerase sigma factor [Terriglobales bacterium]|nr:sigma-70 family RNA polymerase sigma factor [Terriglobales bacterium]
MSKVTPNPVQVEAGDFELVEASIAGDMSAFDELIRRHDGKVFRAAQCIMKNREDAEDVMQEAFLNAFRKLHQFQKKSKFSTWLVRITVNQALMKLRDRPKTIIFSLDEEPEDPNETRPREIGDWDHNPEQLCYASELQETLSDMLHSLRPNMRMAFLLRDMEGFSMEEIADTLGLTAAAVKTCLFRARQQLRKKFSKHLKKKHGFAGGRNFRMPRMIAIRKEAYV